jgi:hypothetical protein
MCLDEFMSVLDLLVIGGLFNDADLLLSALSAALFSTPLFDRDLD